MPQQKKTTKRRRLEARRGDFGQPTIFAQTTSGNIGNQEPVVTRGWQFWMGVIGVCVAVLTIVSQILTQGPLYTALFASKPKPDGHVLFASIGHNLGTTDGYSGSVILVVHLESRSDTPFVPVAYEFEMLIDNQVFATRAVDDEGYTPVVFRNPDSLAVIGRPGTWTVCIPRSRSLLSPQDMHVPITRDKPLDGFIRFASPVGSDAMRRWRDIRLTVLGADGTEYVFKGFKPQLGVGIFRRLEFDIRFVSGENLDSCGRS